MKSILKILALAATASFSFAADKPAEKPAGDKPKQDPEKVFAKKDANADGKLSKEEFTAKAKDPAKAEKSFAKKDKDGDGSVSKEEFTAPAKKAE